jgi:type III secretion protein C
MSNPVLSCFARLVRRAIVATLFVATAVHAGTMPNPARTVSITAREQPIAAFMQTLMAAVDVPVSVSPTLTANVNGMFVGTAEKVLRDISRIYNLVTYYDGAVMHVVPAAEVATRTYAVTPRMSDKLLRDAFDLGLPDLRNTLRNTGNGNLVAVGTKRFLDQIDELTRAGLTQQAAAAAPPAPGMMDFRVFYLRYAWAQDTTMNIGNRQVVVPGVASILRSLECEHGGPGDASDPAQAQGPGPRQPGHGREQERPEQRLGARPQRRRRADGRAQYHDAGERARPGADGVRPTPGHDRSRAAPERRHRARCAGAPAAL